MEFSAYYYEDNRVCIISKKENVIPEYEKVNTKENIIINLDDKNVQNIYDFFRDNTIKIVLSNDKKNISIDYSNIKDEEFYNEESLKKLIELLNSLTKEANNTIEKCIAESKDNEIKKESLIEEKELDND